jgi:hypothetical protein
MNYIFIIICSIILPILSLKQTKPKLCINCKHFIPDKDGDNNYGKCSFFIKEESKTDFLVTGIKEENQDEYFYCSTSRGTNSMCGQEGKNYKKKRIFKNKLIN